HPGTDSLDYVDFDRLRLPLFGFRKLHCQDAVSIGRLYLVGLNGHRQLYAALELSVDPLGTIRVLIRELTIRGALALQGQQVAGDRQRYVLITDARKLEVQNHLILGLVHIENGCPGPHSRARSGNRWRTDEGTEDPLPLFLNVGHAL